MIKKRETAERAIANGKPKANQWSDELLSDPELCLAAIKASTYTAWQIPSRYYTTEEMCIEGIKSGLNLNRIPDEFRTESVCALAVEKNGTNITDVPPEIVTEEMCIDAVRSSPRILAHIQNQTEKICLEAVTADGSTLQFAQVKTLPVCETAVKNNGRSIQFVPDEFITAKMCLSAVLNDGPSLKFIPPKHISKSICMTAVQHQCPLSFVPTEYQSNKLFLEYLKAGGNPHYLPQNKVIEAFEQLVSLKCKIIPTEEEKKNWKYHLYNTLISLAEDDEEFMPKEDDSFETLASSFLFWAHENNGGYKLSGSRFCDWLTQEYEMYYD
jgi:hypothetical protein